MKTTKLQQFGIKNPINNKKQKRLSIIKKSVYVLYDDELGCDVDRFVDHDDDDKALHNAKDLEDNMNKENGEFFERTE